MCSFFLNLTDDFLALHPIKRLLFLALRAVALLSVGQGFMNAQRFGQDFQWSPSVLFLHGRDHPAAWGQEDRVTT